ncbi:uncharacterized protein E0L32_005512 [Thyridium curvatum]|uniref:Major facilitator superfamily (MFS) profile domain-containing protein n=1 Tax=Thyridium curvatum TaxID=1093900 RepID=A0A507B5E4_9PEZI|nr:uncharacterized protein E0L32_005512 [Thyridium curvatum]TPX14316.1 hypothetical protein E0L32_005512 [Thyridium curvatum]
MASEQEKEVSPADEQPRVETPLAVDSDTSSISSHSSVTATDRAQALHTVPTAADVPAPRKQAHTTKVSHWQLVFEPGQITPDVQNYKYSGHGTSESPYVVEWIPDDPHNPFNFPRWKKWAITILQAFATLAVTFVSSAYSGGVREIILYFHISSEVSILGVSLFVLGFAIGPLIWAPFSEFFGRQRLFFITFGLLTAFNAGAAGAQNIATLMILRFFAGSFGSSPLTNAGGVIADMFSADERGLATAIFAAAPFLGPAIGPIAGGFLGEAAGWRWVEGLMAIFTGVIWIIISLWVPETFAPVLMRRRADKLSHMTSKVYVAKLDLHQPRKSMVHQFKIALSRPWILLFSEPIVSLLSIYMAIVYGTLYMMFPAFPIVFQQARGWSPGIGGLAFIGIAVGMMFGVTYFMYDNKRYQAVSAKHKGFAPPEARLPPAIIGSFFIPVGLFWFAWTNGPSVHWIVSIIGSSFFSFGIVLVFLALMNYLVDSYVIFAASVLAANSVLRSLFGAAFPLFTTHMYQNLGLHWASSIPAFLALACVPFPVLFYIYGSRVRAKCAFAAEAADVLQRMRTVHEEIDEDEAVLEVERTRTAARERRHSEAVARARSSSRRRSQSVRRSHSIFNREKTRESQDAA